MKTVRGTYHTVGMSADVGDDIRLLGRLIGVPRQGLGQLLEPIQSFCIVKHLPALTSLGPAVAYQDGVEAHATIVTPASHLRITH